MIKSGFKSIRLVDRVAFLLEFCRDKRVLHLGATDAPETENAVRSNRLLHIHLQSVASYLVGMDNNHDMIALLKTQYGITNIRYGDIEVKADYPQEEFDIVIAGEILEHLSNPGLALDALHSNINQQDQLIITVPNAYSLKGFCRALLGYELIHPDHTSHHSLHALTSLLNRHGFSVTSKFTFVNGGSGWLASMANHILQVFPQLAEGIGLICHPVKSKNSR